MSDIKTIIILPTLSKIFEIIPQNQIREYVETCHLLPCFQSRFRRDYCYATCLTKITVDIMEAFDREECTGLVLVNYSKTFDRKNHGFLLALLDFLGFDGGSYSQISSSLSGRRHAVKLNGSTSLTVTLWFYSWIPINFIVYI